MATSRDTWMDDLDVPIAFEMTDAGWRAATLASTLLLDEACQASGLAPAYVIRAVRRGEVEGIEVDGQWLVDAKSLTAFMAGRVPAAPLLRQILLRGGDHACGVLLDSAEKRALERARACGWLTERSADRLACYVVRMSAWELWPDAC